MDDPIKHVVVLMLENRSFDHLLGAMPGADGIDAKNPRKNFERPGSTRSYVQTDGAAPTLSPDPRHETENVLRQIDGDGLGPMGGFVYDYAVSERRAAKSWAQVMKYFDWRTLSTLHTLAGSFCVCDQWFSSVPGPTWTNRFFALSGTSLGWVDMPHPPFDWNLHSYDQTTVFDRLNEKGISWRIYYGDIPQSLLLKNQRAFRNLKNYRRLGTSFDSLGQFEHDLGSETSDSFPSYVFIEPYYFWPGQNDQHPPIDITKGEDLISRIYNAIRANESIWDSTLLIVTWDEHGGFYDHVPPPPAQPPDNQSKEGFKFDRYGVRVPTLLISKWIKPGFFRLDPKRNLYLDHTSILRYLSDKYALDSLGLRVRSAGSIAGALSSQPMVETPERLEVPSEIHPGLFAEDQPMPPLNHNQAALVDFAEWMERELDAPAAELQARALRSTEGLRERVEVAIERTEKLIESVLLRAP